jgi:hypothetical protein
MSEVKPTVEHYIRVKILDVDIKKQHFERQGYTYVRELSPEDGAKRLSEPLKRDETVLCFSHPLK